MMAIDKIRKIVSVILLLCGMAVIFMFSTMDGEQSTNTSKSIIEISPNDLNQEAYGENELSQKMDEENILTIRMNKRIRKVAHFIEFCILAMALVFALNSFNLNGFKSYLLALMLVFAYACTDELHQLFVSGRDARGLDVIVDTLGGACGLVLYAAISELCIEIKERIFSKTKM